MDSSSDKTTAGETGTPDLMEQSQAIKNMIMGKKSDIYVEVLNPSIRDDTFSKYVVYTVRGKDKSGEFEVIRRYSDFTKLRDMLRSKWPGCYIPPLPPKAMNSLEAKVVKERRSFLTLFCQKIAELPYIHYYDGYQEFLRTKNPSIEKALAPWMKTDYDEIINRYASTFNQLSGKEFNLAVVKKIVDFKTFLKKIEGQTGNFKEIARKMVQAKIAFYQEFAYMNGSVLMEFEKHVFTGYQDRGEGANLFHTADASEFFANTEKVIEGSKKASYEYIHEWMRSENREVAAFIEAIDQKDVYDALKAKAQSKQRSETDDLQKVLSGKQSIKSMIFRKNKEDEVSDLEKKIAKHSSEYESLCKLNDMITLVIAYCEIDKFKNDKINPYLNILRTAAKNELTTLTNIESYWEKVLKNKNLEDA